MIHLRKKRRCYIHAGGPTCHTKMQWRRKRRNHKGTKGPLKIKSRAVVERHAVQRNVKDMAVKTKAELLHAIRSYG